MKLADVLILSLSVVFMIIGIHQIITVGFGESYWIIMVSVTLLFIYNFRKKR